MLRCGDNGGGDEGKLIDCGLLIKDSSQGMKERTGGLLPYVLRHYRVVLCRFYAYSLPLVIQRSWRLDTGTLCPVAPISQALSQKHVIYRVYALSEWVQVPEVTRRLN